MQTGWRPVAEAIDPKIPQRMLRRAHFAVDAIAFPEDPDDPDFYAPPTKLLGVGESGHVEPTGNILWIDTHLECSSAPIGRSWLQAPPHAAPAKEPG